ncbi:MAG: hypothetical protein ACYCQJ_00245 [Nitrososphaerales archaeon]
MNALESGYCLEKWIAKWEFILHNDRELSQAGALVALKQLDEIVLDQIVSR